MNSGDATVRKIRLRQLRCFVAVAREGSFIHAAGKLGLTQPAVSRSIRELEQNVRHDLFDRSSRGAVLTVEGQIFLKLLTLLLRKFQKAFPLLGQHAPYTTAAVCRGSSGSLGRGPRSRF